MDTRFFGSAGPPGVQSVSSRDISTSTSPYMPPAHLGNMMPETRSIPMQYSDNTYKPVEAFPINHSIPITSVEHYPVSYENSRRGSLIDQHGVRPTDEPAIAPIKGMPMPKPTMAHASYSPYFAPTTTNQYAAIPFAQPMMYDMNASYYQRSSSPLMSSKKISQKGRKTRLSWNAQLHRRFVEAVVTLGLKSAVPRGILDLMNVNGLTRENVASHLQKYRIQVKEQYKLKSTSDITDDIIPMDLDDELRVIAERASANRKSNFSLTELKNSSRMPEKDLDDLIDQLHPATLPAHFAHSFTPQHYPMGTPVQMPMQSPYGSHPMDMMRQNPY